MFLLILIPNLDSPTQDAAEFLKQIITESGIETSPEIVDLFVRTIQIDPEEDELAPIQKPQETLLVQKLSLFLQRLSLDNMPGEVDKDKHSPKITVSTIHQAKGLE